MPLGLPTGSACFVDSNIFVYHFVDFGEVSLKCRAFLGGIGSRVEAFSTASCIADAVHRFMMVEAQEKFNLGGGALAWIQRHPERIRELTIFREAAKQMQSLPLRLLEPDCALISEAAELAAGHGLLTNDAIIVALMRRHGLTHLVTNDDDFDRVPGLTVWKPR
jgi:predicted nucleic acid-binding protein